MTRLIAEKNDLKDKIEKLKDFFDTETFANLDEISRDLLREQELVMIKYLYILEDRIEHIESKKE